MLRQLSGMMLLGLLTVVGAGCCGVQCMPAGGMYGSSCGGGCPPGPQMGMAQCGSGCGEVYVDEWINEPPVEDNCGGASCGGCATCRQPVRNVLRLLLGRPYMGQCDSGMCSTGGNGCGCDSMGGESFIGDSYADGGFQPSGHAPSGSKKPCNCGASHGSSEYSQDWSGASQMLDSGNSPGISPTMPRTNSSPRLAPELMPAPSPEANPKPSVAPSSATRRLNPAAARHR